jgi:hypothetical protein
MRFLVSVLLLFAVTFAAAGDATVKAGPGAAALAAAAQDRGQACLEAAVKSGKSVQAAQGACCAKNKGVCGCRAGKIVCCDKTFAEGCACAQDDPLATL